MKEIFKLKTFWIVFIVATFAIFITLLNFNRVYQSQTKILIIPKSNLAVKNSNQVIENLSRLPYTLSFYKRMSQENDDVVYDSILELPNYKREIFWNSKIKIKREGKSGVLDIITLDKSRYKAGVLNNQAVKTLLTTASFYYNIKTDIDIRIVDSMITNYSSRINLFFLSLESLSIGFLITFFSFFISFVLFEKETLPKINHSALFLKSKKPSFVEKKWISEEKPYTDFSKKANAPENLPVAQNSFFENTDKAKISKEETKPLEEKREKDIPIIREATPEEVKKRLNQLLSGN